MNINNNSVGRRETSQTPSPQERAAMRATRQQVRTDETTRREAVQKRPEATGPQTTRERGETDATTRRQYVTRRAESAAVDRPQAEGRDRIEISSRALRRAESAGVDSDTRREAITSLKDAYKNGELSTSERRRMAASQMLNKRQG